MFCFEKGQMNKVFAPSEMEKKLIKGDDDVGLEVKGQQSPPGWHCCGYDTLIIDISQIIAQAHTQVLAPWVYENTHHFVWFSLTKVKGENWIKTKTKVRDERDTRALLFEQMR